MNIFTIKETRMNFDYNYAKKQLQNPPRFLLEIVICIYFDNLPAVAYIEYRQLRLIILAILYTETVLTCAENCLIVIAQQKIR